MLYTLIIFIAILALLVFVHEFGHFLTARKAGVKVKEFGIGFPPRIFGMIKNPETSKWQKIKRNVGETKTTIYSLNLVPLGGFVKIKGEDGSNKEDEDRILDGRRCPDQARGYTSAAGKIIRIQGVIKIKIAREKASLLAK